MLIEKEGDQRMKRLLAGWLAMMLLFAAGITLAENPGEEETVNIEESLVSGEGMDPGSMAQTIRMIRGLLQDEDVKAILKNQEAASVLSEVIARIAAWMIQNKDVTMKILTELGVSETDRNSIEKIWDSLDRINESYKAYLETEDGKQLAAEYAAVKNDPDVIQAAKDFRTLSTSEDLEQLLKALDAAVEADKTNNEMENGRLTQAVMDREVNDKTFIGALIIEIMQVLDHSPWAQKSVPKLANNENVLKLLKHLGKGNPDQDKLIREELQLILGDSEVKTFILNVIRDGHELYKALENPDDPADPAAEPETTGQENTVEEVAP
jgi:hypothetical protein